MLIGRKGVGKSAFSARIMSIADTDEDVIAEQMSLNDFQFEVFEKTNISDDVEGTRKYKASWDFVLLLKLYSMIYNSLQIKEVDEINEMINILAASGYKVNTDIRHGINFLTKLKLGIKLKIFEADVEGELNNTPLNYVDKINFLTEKMIESLKKVYINGGKLILLIDGLDDILRFNKNQVEILASLIRSVEYLNKIFIRFKMSFKIILFIREDIMNTITDPDFNKIKRDGGVTLNWYNRSDDLMDILKLRLRLSGVPENEMNAWWFNTFPKRIKKKDSWNFILDHTLGKPRDVLQFMITCAEIYPHNDKLNYSELRACLKEYSTNYFLGEMSNELAGFINDDIINTLPSVLRRLGGRYFTLDRFKNVQNEQISRKEEITTEDVKNLLLLLFEAGYIGQLMPTQNYSNGKTRVYTNVIFKYRNPAAVIDYSERFIIHKGLFNALDIRG